jgi:glycosyltransferase involved in cell wall biosynthesis
MTVGGHPQQLARAERGVGLASRCVAFYPANFGPQPDEVLFGSNTPRLVKELRRFTLLCRAFCSYDVVHFNFGRGFFGPPRGFGHVVAEGGAASRLGWACRELYCSAFYLSELPVLKWLGKAVVVTFQGDDARQSDYCRAHHDITFANHPDCAGTQSQADAVKRATIAAFARYADRIFAHNPDLLAVLPRCARFQPYASVNLDEWRPTASPSSDGPVHVVHAPTDRVKKGTEFIIAAVQKLRQDGFPLYLSIVENRPPAEARKIYENADLLLDQLLVGWYGGVALECMALGKPVVCYIRESDLGCLPSAMRGELPIIRATPDDLYHVLQSLCTDKRHMLAEFGARARKFAERWHDPRRIASEMKQTYATILKRPGAQPGGP